MKLRYPITSLSGLRSERKFFLRCRATIEGTLCASQAGKRSSLARIDSQLDFNARLIEQGEREQLGHLATAGAYLF